MKISGISPYVYAKSNVKFANNNKSNATNFGKFLDNESKNAMHKEAVKQFGEERADFFVNSLEASKIIEIKMGDDGIVKGKVLLEHIPTFSALGAYEKYGCLDDMVSYVRLSEALPLVLGTAEDYAKNPKAKHDDNCGSSDISVQSLYAGFDSYPAMRAEEEAYGIRFTP